MTATLYLTIGAIYLSIAQHAIFSNILSQKPKVLRAGKKYLVLLKIVFLISQILCIVCWPISLAFDVFVTTWQFHKMVDIDDEKENRRIKKMLDDFRQNGPG